MANKLSEPQVVHQLTKRSVLHTRSVENKIGISSLRGKRQSNRKKKYSIKLKSYERNGNAIVDFNISISLHLADYPKIE
jgi:hypothetical protein